jgi:predicted ATPase
MIERIRLENFKASRDVDVRIAPLTVLAGLNSSGKSSLLQAIAVLRQSYGATGRADGLVLGGDLVQLGHGRDVLSEGADSADDALVFEFQDNGRSYRWICPSVPDASELRFRDVPREPPEFVSSMNFQFLQADRVTPSPLYPQSLQQSQSTGFLGPRGELTADFLAQNVDKTVSESRSSLRAGSRVDPALLARVSPTPKLLDQVASWLQHLSPGARLKAARVEGTDEVLLQYNYVGHARGPTSNDYRPTNVGFGLTYALPVLVACLASPPGSLLLLENPEAHLHPQGQVALGELLALAAMDAVQIIVETHSDHLLNGIRVAVKQGRLSYDKVVLHFFTRRVETGESCIESPSMLSDGRLSNWPAGFFDQWEKTLDALID